MNNSDDRKSGGASIKPSARRSIHSHAFCPFALGETMGRFGLMNNERENKAQTSNHRANRYNVQGTDEVDNVFSKPAHPISPPKHTNNKLYDRRNSLDFKSNESWETREEEASNILSKSLPATLPSHSYYSDYSDEEDITQQDNVYSDTSYNSARSGSANRTPKATRNMHLVNRTTQTSGSNLNRNGSIRMRTLPKSGNEDQSSFRMVMPILVLLAGVFTSIIMYYQTNTSVKDIDESRFYNDIDLLGNKYRIGGNAILLMQTGISTILERQDTGSFMFVYNSRDRKYNQDKFNTFINNISETTSKYLRNRVPVHYTMVEGSALKMRDHGELINRFRDDLDRTGVMLVKDVEAIPSELAMAFHYYCDEYNPLVKKSAIFFTLNLAECNLVPDMKSTHAAIEKCLAQKWNGVPSDSIGPLLTRVKAENAEFSIISQNGKASVAGSAA